MNQRISSRVASWIGNSAVEGWPWGVAAMKRCCPWWNWKGEAPGLSVASRPLCPLTLQALQSPPLTARHPRLRQIYQ
jgi:hypothetical protein